MPAQQPSGMVVAQVVDLGHQLAVRADQLDTMARRIAGLLQHLYWHGPKADRFRNDLIAHLPALTHCAQALRGLSQRAAENAQEQQRTSQADGGRGPGLFPSFVGDPTLLERLKNDLFGGDSLPVAGGIAAQWAGGGEIILKFLAVDHDASTFKTLLEAAEKDSLYKAGDVAGAVGALIQGGVFAWKVAHDPDSNETYAYGGSAVASLTTGLVVGAMIGGPVGALAGGAAGALVGFGYDELEKHYPGMTKHAIEDVVGAGMAVGQGYMDMVHSGADLVENGLNTLDGVKAVDGIVSGGINKLKSIF